MVARIVAERCTYVPDSSEREGAEAGGGRRLQIGSNQSLAPLSVSFLITLYACPRRVRRSFSSILHQQSIEHIRCLFQTMYVLHFDAGLCMSLVILR